LRTAGSLPRRYLLELIDNLLASVRSSGWPFEQCATPRLCLCKGQHLITVGADHIVGETKRDIRILSCNLIAFYQLVILKFVVAIFAPVTPL
jgi:hypothetical protein